MDNNTILEHKIEQKSQVNFGFVIKVTLVAALGGLLFGYDTAVISGAIGSLETFFQLSAAEKGWAASSALVGCIIGAAAAGNLATILGRKKSLIIAGILFFISAFGSAIPESFTVFIIFRIIGGLGVGIASMLSPMYIAEIAPAAYRGRLVSCNQFAIIFGMLVVYFVNYYIAGLGDNSWIDTVGWRWMFASECIPALTFTGLLFIVPESPRWLAMKNRDDEALKILDQISENASLSLNDIKLSLHASKNEVKVSVFQKPYMFIVFVGVMLSIFQQVTGINVFLYYAPEIFKKLGGGNTDTALLQTIVVGSVNLLFTVIAIFSVDKFGRKPLMLIGSLGMGICISAIGTAAYFGNTDVWLLAFVLGYIACFALSLGPVVWVLLSEIMPNAVRGVGLSIAVAFQWIFNFIVSQTFPMMMDNDYLFNTYHGAFPFWVYGFMCLLTILFVWKYVPETKGKSLEEMETLFK
ncbi:MULTISPECIES: sugar porter family MFS transporter [Flammeovirga]|uniref:Sugar porter family MFS transporter n=1 Tax=Flammeovirga agarivorans TaxID=2726742 RepID=A0A7X8XZ87_9BACT|nr:MULTISPECIES: sugar porter family MFS transporter [Flammeovirga]NLR94833.1 sugar porter family MFS transporter [Flammeovirga agarivorans]